MRRVKIVLVNGKVIDAACTFSRQVIRDGRLAKLHFITDQGPLLFRGSEVVSAVEYYAPAAGGVR